MRGLPQFAARSLSLLALLLLVILGLNPEVSLATMQCHDCHGTGTAAQHNVDNRPLDASERDTSRGGFVGNHRTHLGADATAASCTPCHQSPDAVPALYSSWHRDGKIQLAENINNSPHPDKGGYYKNGEKAVYFNQTTVPLLGSCRNVNCHFESDTPTWGSTYLAHNACSSCHASPPGDGSHGRHVSTLGATTASCKTCHTSHVDETEPLAHAREAGSRSLALRFTTFPNLTGSYSGNVSYPHYLPSQHPARNGSCSALYCHSAGKAVTTQPAPPVWGGSALGCNGCHGIGTSTGAPNYVNGGAGEPFANTHPGHMNSGSICADCHIGTTVTGTSIVAGSILHINKALDVTLKEGGSYDPQTKTCYGTSCHGDGNPRWGGIIPGGACAICHGSDAGGSKPIQTGKHPSHMNNYTTLGWGNNLLCGECHSATVSGNSILIGSGRHRNGLVDYSGAKAGKIAVAGSGRCATAYCHSSGTRENQYWNMSSATWYSTATFSCSGCHGGLTLPDGTFQTYTSVAGEPTYPNSGAGTLLANSHQKHVQGIQTDTTGCSRCHRSTVDAGIANKLRDYSSAHLDRSRTVQFSEAIQGRYSATSRQCLNLYCHSNGQPFDNSTTVYRIPTWGDSSSTCGSCHGDTASASTLSGRHGKHTASTIYLSTCSRCHLSTINDDGTLKDKRLHANKAKEIAFREGGSYDPVGKGCSTTYCHSDAAGGAPTTTVKWSDKDKQMKCYSCHKGILSEETEAACNAINGVWSSATNKLYCTPGVTMTSNGHNRLASPRWIRKYPCSYCHYDTVTADGTIRDRTKHLNGNEQPRINVSFSDQWAIIGRPVPSYDSATKTCDNIYCHSDGTTDPEEVKPFPWTRGKTACNTCHGHPLDSCSSTNCHDDTTHSDDGLFWPLKTGWAPGEEWKAAVPMFPNEGPGLARANSHPRHAETNFTCDNCHAATIKPNDGNSSCYGTSCHTPNQPLPAGSMSEAPHLIATYHANRTRDVFFKDGGTYSSQDKTCRNTKCHTGRELNNDPTFKLSLSDPVWGSTSSSMVCVSCHGTTTGDVDNFGPVNSTRAKINTTEWITTGHGRMSSATNSRYPGSGNPAANFPINPCWYCHDNRVLHNDTAKNFFRLRLHLQFQNRFDKECVYCHMTGQTNAECLDCHNITKSLAPQLANITSSHIATARWANRTSTVIRPDHRSYTGYSPTADSCLANQGASKCHSGDAWTHNQGAGYWSRYQKDDVKNQYVMMGVCLKCHDDDSGGKCTSCHPGNEAKYKLGFDPGTGFIKPKVARATSAHFGYKHYRAFTNSGSDYGHGKTGWNNYTGHAVGTWKGGKFCWDCHDPHGDSNIYMIHSMVATSTDGRFGIPFSTKKVVFTRKLTGGDYTTFDEATSTYTGICNVCHSPSSKHYTSVSADSHNSSKVCTTCHEHRFTDSHADKNPCNSCHQNKPVPRHSGFGLPRDCTKCHTGTLNKRMDIMGQFKGTSHHVQGVEVTNKHCYACHWEATSEGVIDTKYHEGYNYKTYTSVRNAKSDLVVWRPGKRPTYYNVTTAIQFVASRVSSPDLATSRSEVTKLNNHCISCHSDQNNHTKPFDDCKTPKQYAWDQKSIDARYSQKGDAAKTTWGKYSSVSGMAANGKKQVIKAFSAHGNATENQGGWSIANGVDSNIPNLRANSYNVQCYDCHSSHGSKLLGVTSSYVTFNGTSNGGNLKETVAGTGGYNMTYKASANSSGVNPYKAGAGQCFDCHLTPTSGATPWGYGTFGLNSPVKGYFDSDRFGGAGITGATQRYPFKTKANMRGGHLKSSSSLGNYTTSAQNRINGLCTPCHDPHGVSPALGSNQAYAVPLLKGTWMTSPYKEDTAYPSLDRRTTGSKGQQSFSSQSPTVHTDNNTLYKNISTCYPDEYGEIYCNTTAVTTTISEDTSKFAGLCLQCHSRSKLNGGTATGWKGVDRIHKSVKGWGGNHSFTCSKCHAPHATSLPRLMVTNCLNYKHRGNVVSGTSTLFYTGSGKVGHGGGGFPGKGWRNNESGSAAMNCHPTGTWPDNTWNDVTPW